MQELKGMAAVAQVPFSQALMYTMEEEFSYLVPENLRYNLADHCSDVLIQEDDQCTNTIKSMNYSGSCS